MRTGEYDAAGGSGGVESREGGVEVIEEGGREGIELLGAIEGDEGDSWTGMGD